MLRLKSEFASNYPKFVCSSIILFVDDDMVKLVEMRSLEMFLLQNLNMKVRVIIIADTRHTQRWFKRKVDPMLCNGDLAFFFNCPATLETLHPWAHERPSSLFLHPVSHETWSTWKQSNLQTFSERSLKINI